MGNRLSKIYTRTGDDGSTGLGDGTRVGKDSARVTAYGTVDEANSSIGVVLAAQVPDDIRVLLTRVQHQLFDLGGELCIPGHAAITTADIDALEQQLDHYNDPLPPLKDFILPGRRRSGGALPPGTHHRAPGRARNRHPGPPRRRASGSHPLPQPPVRPAVRAGARAGTRRRPGRSVVEPRPAPRLNPVIDTR